MNHIKFEHIKKRQTLFICQWKGCSNHQRFPRLETFMRHVKAMHTFPEQFQCPVGSCERKFPRKDKFSSHLKEHHRQLFDEFKCKEKRCRH